MQSDLVFDPALEKNVTLPSHEVAEKEPGQRRGRTVCLVCREAMRG
jgi:hypothetical protein